MKVDERATPLALVVSVSDAVPFANVPLAPVVGAVKVTDTPPIGDPPVVTVTINGAANGAPAVEVCGDPPVIMIATELTFITPPQPGRNATRQTKAKIVPLALYFIGSFFVPDIGRRLDASATMEKFRSRPHRVEGPPLSRSSHKKLVVLRIFSIPVASTS